MDNSILDFSSTDLLKKLQSLTPEKNFLIAYSGGLDSHVLLHLVSQLKDSEYNFRAMHINHGLQDDAQQWSDHCRSVCHDLTIPFIEKSLHLKIESGESVEEKARTARYQALYESIAEGEILLTAHHQNDQAETLLLQLFRGAGVQGLAAMPELREFGSKIKVAQHARPLLNQTHQFFMKYADLHDLKYIEDPSNADQSFDRNFLRHTIMPQLRDRWLGIDKTLSRAAMIQAETLDILDVLAEQALRHLIADDNTLMLDGLDKYSVSKQKLFVRKWININGFANPSSKKLEHIFSDLVQAQPSSQPLIEWQGAEIRRFQNKLYLMQPLSEHDTAQEILWDGAQDLELPSINTILSLDDFPLGEKSVTVRFRQGGEKIEIPQRGTISLKNLLQESAVPPWLRTRLPLIYSEEKLLKVIGL